MKATILNDIPISGSVEEVQFNARGNCTWVEFDGQEESWVGVFGRGLFDDRKNFVLLLGEGKTAFVNAGGQGYMIDVKTRKCVSTTDNSCIVSAIAIPGVDIIVACDFTELEIYGATGLQWRSNRVARDGIVFWHADARKVFGQLWQIEGWYSFEISVAERTFKQNELLSSDWRYRPASFVEQN